MFRPSNLFEPVLGSLPVAEWLSHWRAVQKSVIRFPAYPYRMPRHARAEASCRATRRDPTSPPRSSPRALVRRRSCLWCPTVWRGADTAWHRTPAPRATRRTGARGSAFGLGHASRHAAAPRAGLSEHLGIGRSSRGCWLGQKHTMYVCHHMHRARKPSDAHATGRPSRPDGGPGARARVWSCHRPKTARTEPDRGVRCLRVVSLRSSHEWRGVWSRIPLLLLSSAQRSAHVSGRTRSRTSQVIVTRCVLHSAYYVRQRAVLSLL